MGKLNRLSGANRNVERGLNSKSAVAAAALAVIAVLPGTKANALDVTLASSDTSLTLSPEIPEAIRDLDAGTVDEIYTHYAQCIANQITRADQLFNDNGVIEDPDESEALAVFEDECDAQAAAQIQVAEFNRHFAPQIEEYGFTPAEMIEEPDLCYILDEGETCEHAAQDVQIAHLELESAQLGSQKSVAAIELRQVQTRVAEKEKIQSEQAETIETQAAILAALQHAAKTDPA